MPDTKRRGVRLTLGMIVVAAAISGCMTAAAPEANSLWAFPGSTPAPAGAPAVQPAPTPDPNEVVRIPDGAVTFRRAELRNAFAAPDWRPQDHPVMPEIVAHGRRPDVRACGYCHLPTGNGRPENARVSGLSAEYIVRQLRAYREGLRKSSAGKGPPALMAAIAKAMTDEEMASAAAYFSSLTPQSHLRIVETDTAPRTIAEGTIYKKIAGGGDEPLGQRIIETPEDFEQFELRDPATKFVAYVPKGSVARGKRLAASWGGVTMACGNCHGRDLKGLGNVPGLAGKSPTFLVRQLYDFKAGARRGADSAQMVPVVEHMSDADMLAIAAYLASLPS
jgi:cytochrome c553